MHLLIVEVLHFLRSDDLVIVEVNDFEPVVQWLRCCFVFFTQHEVNEIFISHLISLLCFELPRNLLKDTIDSFPRKSVAFIPWKILLINDKVMISVQLPKPAVQHIKMLIWEVLPYLIDVVFRGYLPQNTKQGRVLEVSVRDLAIIVHVQTEKYTHDHCFWVSILKFRCCLQKF